jgi:hypothetical protein
MMNVRAVLKGITEAHKIKIYVKHALKGIIQMLKVRITQGFASPADQGHITKSQGCRIAMIIPAVVNAHRIKSILSQTQLISEQLDLYSGKEIIVREYNSLSILILAICSTVLLLISISFHKTRQNLQHE